MTERGLARRARPGAPRRSRIALVVVAIALWWIAGRLRETSATSAGPEAPAASSAAPRANPGPGDPHGRPPARLAPIPYQRPVLPDVTRDVTVTGSVRDLFTRLPVGGVEVVFLGASGEASTLAGGDGAYSIALSAGMYRAFVRDDTVLSVGQGEAPRLPSQPSAEGSGAPDEALLAVVMATADIDGVDLTVMRGGVVSGKVVDRAGRPVAGAAVRARGGTTRPALATDVAETDPDGNFELRLPAASYLLEASHPRFAGVGNPSSARLAVEPGDRVRTTLTLTAGCVITGRVIDRAGRAAGDGAIERQWGQGELEYAPAGRIESDGTFRWVTTEETDVTLRAWPWKSPPSGSQRFTCRDGARFDSVVFELTDRRPDISGVLFDHAHLPVGATYVDLQPLDAGGVPQQERTDEAGRWEVYNMPPGRYRVIARTADRGVAEQVIQSPGAGIQLALRGTGRLEGTTSQEAGSFEIVLGTCIEEIMIPLPQTRRVITVTGGRFAIDDLPACKLTFQILHHGQMSVQHAEISAGQAAHLALDLGDG